MKVLFCSDTFPGRFGPLASAFAAEGHQVLFASHYGRRDYALPGVGRVHLKPVRRRPVESPAEAAKMEWARALATARYAEQAFSTLRASGFVPDLAIFSASSGAALALSRLWPEAVLLGCAESATARAWSEEDEAARLRRRACLTQSHACFAFSRDHMRELPPMLRSAASLLPPAVDTGFFSPEAAQPFVWQKEARPAPRAPRVLSEASEPLDSPDSRAPRLSPASPAAPAESAPFISVDIRSAVLASSEGLWRLLTGLMAHDPRLCLCLTCAEADARLAAEAMAATLPPAWQARIAISEFTNMHLWRDMVCASLAHLSFESMFGGMPLPEILEALSCGALLALPEDDARALAAYLSGLSASAPAPAGNEPLASPASPAASPVSSPAPGAPSAPHPAPLAPPLSAPSPAPLGSPVSLVPQDFLLSLPKDDTDGAMTAFFSALTDNSYRKGLKSCARNVTVNLCRLSLALPGQFSRVMELYGRCVS